MGRSGARTLDPGTPQRRTWPHPPVPLLIGPGMLAALVALLVVSAPARTRADDFLHLFRTARREPLAIIDVSLPRAPGIDTSALLGAVSVELSTGIEVASSHDAQDRVDFNVRSLRRQQAPQVRVFLDQTATIRIDRAALERTLASVLFPGFRLPRELDTPIQAQIIAGVQQVWPDPAGDITLWITRNPRPYTTEGPSWEELRGRLLQIAAVVTPDSARQLQRVTDWDNTLVVPVPPGAATHRVRADHIDNALLIEQDGRATLIWTRNGVIHVLDARMPGTALVRLADMLR